MSKAKKITEEIRITAKVGAFSDFAGETQFEGRGSGKRSITLVLSPASDDFKRLAGVINKMSQEAFGTSDKENKYPRLKRTKGYYETKDGQTVETWDKDQISIKVVDYIEDYDGNSRPVASLFDSQTNKLPESVARKIGQETEIKADIKLKTYESAIGKGISATFMKGQILKFVEKGANEGSPFEMIEGGFTFNGFSNEETTAATSQPQDELSEWV